jgi:predicted nucleic acid-binding protein
MTEYLLDADVLIGYLRKYPDQVELLKTLARGGNELAVATITVVEIRLGMQPEEAKRTDALLQSLRTYDLDYKIARMTGDYIRDYRRRGMTLSIPDAVVAATAIANHLVLVTYNSAHYPMPEIRLL